MHQSIYPVTKATKIAKWLFFINLVPALLAGVVTILTFTNLVLSRFKSIYDWVLIALLLLGLMAQYIYYQQMTNTDHVINPSGWKYSIIINIFFIIGHLANFIRNPSLVILMVVYPAIFLAISIKGLKLIRHSEASSIS